MKRSVLLLTTFLALASIMKAQTYEVVFVVDMNNVTDAFTTPEVNGNFNGWCGGCAPMSDDDGDNVWNLTIALEAGTYEYKFAADTWAIQENLTPGDECTLTTSGFTNRVLEVSEDMELDTVCWGSCDACEATVPSHSILFKVDMNDVTESFTTPEVNGVFNGWCGGCAPMSDDDGDNVWELAITLEEGTYEYKFAADSWSIQEELTEGSPCTSTIDGFTNRTITVSADAELEPVCWASCDVCSTPTAISEVNGVTLNVWPQPANAFLNIEYNGAINNNTYVSIIDLQGQVHVNTKLLAGISSINVNELAAGLYMLAIVDNGTIVSNTRVMIQ